MNELMPGAEFDRISLCEVVFGGKLGRRLQTGPCHCYWNHGAMENGRGSAAELLLPRWRLDPVAMMDRFIVQPKFAGKTYTGRNQGRDSGRNQTFLFQEVLLILDMYSVPLLHLLHVKNRSPSWIKLRIPYTVRFATVCNILHKQILHKQQKLNMWHILHIMHISRWYLYGYSRLVQHSCRELPEPPWRLANESRELVFCGSDASIWSR